AREDKSPAERDETEARSDAGTVVGNVMSGDEVLKETAIAGGGRRRGKGRVKAAPAVRAEAKRRGIDLAQVIPSGKNGQVTQADLGKFEQQSGQRAKPAARPQAPGITAAPGQSEPLRGPRRAMAQSMTRLRDEVALCTLFDDADIHEWINKRDFTPRILRSVAAGCAA